MVHARTFSLASKLLPATKRRAAYALYAFCRIADDLVDQADHDNVAELAIQLDAYRNQLQSALDGRPSGPIFREVAWVAREYEVSPAPLFELLDGVRRDLEAHTYGTWLELEQYCEGVASSVGEMCTYVFGVPTGPTMRTQAIQYARTLGTAMQLTNILRDVGEDARNNRIYLPMDELKRFGVPASDILGARYSEAFSALMRFQAERALACYDQAMALLPVADRKAQRPGLVMAAIYRQLLLEIQRDGFQVLHQRTSLTPLRKLWLAWSTWVRT
jgi:phytoene synthase